MAEKGIALFNARRYWDAHEALEQAWLEEPGPARLMYIGILQAGVVYLQIERCNFVGAAKMYARSQKYLLPLPAFCRGVDLARLKADLDAAMDSLATLGPDGLAEFDTSLFKSIEHISQT